MKTMKRITLLLGILFAAVAVHAQKFGHITSEQLLQAMPEYDSAQIKMDKLRQEYDQTIENMQVDINKKIEEFNNAEGTMSNLIREAKASEIQEMQVRLQNFAQNAQQDLQQQSMVLIQPVMDRARKAIEAVAREKGLLYVFDLSQGNPVYTGPESLDMLPLVKTQMGL
jgi:outer membrane protein